MHTSTSPQYGLIASLDVGRKQAVMEGYKLLSRTLELAQEVRKLINSTRVFRVLELEDLLPEAVRHDGIKLDPTKVTIDISGCGYWWRICRRHCSSASTSRSRSRRSTRSRCCRRSAPRAQFRACTTR